MNQRGVAEHLWARDGHEFYVLDHALIEICHCFNFYWGERSNKKEYPFCLLYVKPVPLQKDM